MNNEVDFLKERVQFLEMLLEINSGTLEEVMKTNRMLVEELKREQSKAL